MASKETLYCSTCSKEFKRKTCFDKHIVVCANLNNNNLDNIPTQREMYLLVLDLNKKYTMLEKKYTTLQNKYNQLVVKNKKTPIDYLKENIKVENSFDRFINLVEIDDDYIEHIINNSFSECVSFIITNEISKKNINSLQCFTNKDRLYIYREEWCVLEINLLKEFVEKIRQKLFIKHKEFISKNKNKLYEEKFATDYANTINKLTEQNDREYTSIKNKIYKNFQAKLELE